jgi:hypothetical protein
VLSTDNDSVYSLWNDSSVIVLVLNGDLSLGIRSEPWQASVSASSGHSSVKLVCQLQSQWEQFWGLIGSISEHDTLVTSTQLLETFVKVKTLSDIGRLFFNGNQDVAGLVVEALGGIIVSDILDGPTDNLLVVQTGFGGDLTENHNHTGLGGSLTSNLGQRVLGQACVENSIGDLISDLVWVSLSYRFGLNSLWLVDVVDYRAEGKLTVKRKVPLLWWDVPLTPFVDGDMFVN